MGLSEVDESNHVQKSGTNSNQPINIPEVSSNELCTKPLYYLLEDYLNVLDAFFFMVHLATSADRISLNAAKVLSEGGREDDLRRYEERLKNPDPASKRIQKYSWYTSRNLVNTIVDAYLSFISTMIQSVLARVPDAMRSSETIRVEEILDFSSKSELVSYLVERKVNSLSYGGLNAIEKYLQSNLGVSLYRDEKSRLDVLFVIEVRNINSHNRGYVNRLFVDRTRSLKREVPSIGKRSHIDLDLLGELSASILDSSRFLDEQIASKFRIRRKKLQTWKNA